MTTEEASSLNLLPAGAQCTSKNDDDDGSGTCRWLAIPFAEPLKQRFAPSKPRKDIAEASLDYGPACFQFDKTAFDSVEQSEDCLTLNIWAPNKVSNDRDGEGANDVGNLPVMVFIHGGGFLIGSSSFSLAGYGLPGNPDVKMFDGALLADNQDVVVVVLQYRLGPFGFLPMLDGEVGTNTTGGSNGIGDQITALQWVQMHVDKFGGDPAKVTIFGQSSGSVSVCALLHSPAAKGLFHRAIMESGSCYTSIDLLYTKQEALSFRDKYIQRIDDGGDLYTASAEEILLRTFDAYGDDWPSITLSGGFGAPSVDGYVLPDLPANLKPLAGIPVMVGTNSFDESVPSIPGGRESFLATFGLLANDPVSTKILESYSSDDDANLFQDACLRCPSQKILEREIERNPETGHFWYTFDCPKDTAMHGTETVSLFGNVDEVIYEVTDMFGPPPTEALIERMQLAWASFARSGDPGWEDVSTSGMGALIGCNSTTVRPLMDKYGTCDLWTSAAASVGGIAVGHICMEDSYVEEGDEDGSSPTFLAVASCSVAAILLCYAAYRFCKRRAGYSVVRDVKSELVV